MALKVEKKPLNPVPLPNFLVHRLRPPTYDDDTLEPVFNEAAVSGALAGFSVTSSFRR